LSVPQTMCVVCAVANNGNNKMINSFFMALI
jgi:hypothetical protein